MEGYSRNKEDFREKLVEKYVRNHTLYRNKKSMGKINFKKGDKVGMLTILGETEHRECGIYEKCQCDCGNIKWVYRYHLSNGKIRSCGCLAKKLSTQRLLRQNTKHGMYGTHIYNKYIHAKDRCNNPNNISYKIYGGRGIRFLWDSFEDFYNDMGESYNVHVAKYGKKNTTIDRINVDGDYCKENCRWATMEEQNNNRRTNTKVVYMGKEYSSLNKLAEAFGIKKHILHHRLKYGWTLKDTIETPVQKRNFTR